MLENPPAPVSGPLLSAPFLPVPPLYYATAFPRGATMLVERTGSVKGQASASCDQSKRIFETARTNELLCEVLCHNICCVIQSMYEFGIEAEFGGVATRTD